MMSPLKRILLIAMALVLVVVVLVIAGSTMKPAKSSIEKCQESYSNLTSLQHVYACYAQCCEKPVLQKSPCIDACYLIN